MQTINEGETVRTVADDDSAAASLRISQLSPGDRRPLWTIAVFAHNEARLIKAALESIVEAAAGHAVCVYVLANGCTDKTADEVRACAGSIPNLWLIEIPLADKANAWNAFIHDLYSDEQARAFETWFFMDGDVTLKPSAMTMLASSLKATPDADAAGGMPDAGRDRDAWRQRMVINGMLAGNFYALRGSFVRRLREFRIRMPVGLIGEDFFLSWLVHSIVWRNEEAPYQSRSVFNPTAEFLFNSLSPRRPADYRTYLYRKWRYTLRGIQHQMLVTLLINEGLASMPSNVEELYRRGPLPSRLRWAGVLQTPLHLLAALKVRSFR